MLLIEQLQASSRCGDARDVLRTGCPITRLSSCLAL